MIISRFFWPTSTIAMLSLLVACGPQDRALSADNADAEAVEANALAPAQTSTPTQPQLAERPAPEPEPIVCATCGVVAKITEVQQAGQRTGVGAVAGAVVGGVVGNQVGGGSGRKIATAAGVIGGALAGNTIEKKRKASSWYEVTVRMENGDRQVISVQDATGIAVGSAVTVQGSDIYLR